MNSITELLNLEDADIFISNISINGTKKILTLETKPIRHFCPVCGFKMYSRGIKVRTINHPVLQDGYELVLSLYCYKALISPELLLLDDAVRFSEITQCHSSFPSI